jgi:hypothetical protein
MLEGVFGVLAFFVSLLVLGVGAASILIAILRRRPRQAWKIARLCLGWVAVYAVILVLVALTSRPVIIPLGQERCFDEMCYSVQAVSSAPTLSTPAGSLAAQGDFLLITVQLRSAARRTAQRPSEPALFLLDADGQRQTRILDAGSGQPVTARQVWDQAVQPGETILRRIAFDLPAGARAPYLVMSEGLGAISVLVIGDENSPFHARTVFALTH